MLHCSICQLPRSISCQFPSLYNRGIDALSHNYPSTYLTADSLTAHYSESGVRIQNTINHCFILSLRTFWFFAWCLDVQPGLRLERTDGWTWTAGWHQVNSLSHFYSLSGHHLWSTAHRWGSPGRAEWYDDGALQSQKCLNRFFFMTAHSNIFQLFLTCVI